MGYACKFLGQTRVVILIISLVSAVIYPESPEEISYATHNMKRTKTCLPVLLLILVHTSTLPNAAATLPCCSSSETQLLANQLPGCVNERSPILVNTASGIKFLGCSKSCTSCPLGSCCQDGACYLICTFLGETVNRQGCSGTHGKPWPGSVGARDEFNEDCNRGLPPVSTSSAPVSTSSAPVSTSSAPVSTSSAPVSTSSAPVSTSSKEPIASGSADTSPSPKASTIPKNSPEPPASIASAGAPGELLSSIGEGGTTNPWPWLGPVIGGVATIIAAVLAAWIRRGRRKTDGGD